MVPPGASRPARSPASISAPPMRSLTLPPGLKNSTLAASVAPSGWKRRSRTSGVSPRVARMSSWICKGDRGRRGRSADAQQLDLEHQVGVGRDQPARALLAVAQRRRNEELALAAHAHAGESLVPALDHRADAELELERRAAVAAGVELGAVLQPAGVMHLDHLAGLGLVAFADLLVDVLEARCGDDLLACFLAGFHGLAFRLTEQGCGERAEGSHGGRRQDARELSTGHLESSFSGFRP